MVALLLTRKVLAKKSLSLTEIPKGRETQDCGHNARASDSIYPS